MKIHPYFQRETLHHVRVRTGSPSRGGDVTVFLFDRSQPSVHTPFDSVLVSVSVLMSLSTVFHSINSPDNSPLSYSTRYLLMNVSFSPDIVLRG